MLAIAPVAFFAWGVLDALPERASSEVGAAFVVADLVFEIARWLSTAFVFGLLYPRLPGWIGPLKGLGLAAVWIAGASATEVGNRWLDAGTGRVWTFPALQMLLFLVALGTAYDHATLVRAGLGWSGLQTLYGVERTRSFVLAAVPIVLAVLAIGQQAVSGTGLEFVRSVVESVPVALPEPPRRTRRRALETCGAGLGLRGTGASTARSPRDSGAAGATRGSPVPGRARRFRSEGALLAVGVVVAGTSEATSSSSSASRSSAAEGVRPSNVPPSNTSSSVVSTSSWARSGRPNAGDDGGDRDDDRAGDHRRAEAAHPGLLGRLQQRLALGAADGLRHDGRRRRATTRPRPGWRRAGR